MREALAKTLCVVYGDVIDQARKDADALLPVARRIAAEELRAAAEACWDPMDHSLIRRRAEALDPAPDQ